MNSSGIYEKILCVNICHFVDLIFFLTHDLNPKNKLGIIKFTLGIRRKKDRGSQPSPVRSMLNDK